MRHDIPKCLRQEETGFIDTYPWRPPVNAWCILDIVAWAAKISSSASKALIKSFDILLGIYTTSSTPEPITSTISSASKILRYI
jgi:hypothetical protein